MMEMRRGDEVTVVGLREDLEECTPPLDHEVLVRVTFNDPSDQGLPSREELDIARRYEDWIAAHLQARCPVEKAVQMTGNGVRDVYFYCSDPAAALRAWEEELQPAIRSHQVAFYVRESPDREVLNNLLEQRNNASRSPSRLVQAVHEFLTASLEDQRDLLEQMPSLWLPAHLFAFGAARAVADAEQLQRNQMLSLAYTLFIRCLGQPAEQAGSAMDWIIEHEADEPTEALIALGHEAFAAWRAGQGGIERLGEVLAQMRQASEQGDE
jgi:hypothetical protein